MSGMSTEIDKDNILKFHDMCSEAPVDAERGVISIDRFVLLTTDSELKPESDLPSRGISVLDPVETDEGAAVATKYNVGQLPALVDTELGTVLSGFNNREEFFIACFMDMCILSQSDTDL